MTGTAVVVVLVYSCVPHVTLLTPAKMHTTSGRGRSCSLLNLLPLLAALALLGTIAGEHQQETVEETQEETDKEKQEDKEESQGDNKEEEQKKEEEEHTGPPPFEDLYCGHMNCYDLLGVTR